LETQRAIGSRIRVLREARTITQTQLAARAGISRPTLANYEAGRQTMTVRALDKIARALDVALTALV
jgi:transcriptional regulator with XRE-family HTH domain